MAGVVRSLARGAAGTVGSLPPRALRLAVAAAAIVCAVAGLYLFAVRDLWLFRVDTVTVTGLTTREGPKVRAALVGVGRDMTTLHLRRGDLEAAAAAYPVVRGLRVKADFPDRLEVRVIEHRPVARVARGRGSRVYVALDGTVLRGFRPNGRLPLIEAGGPLRGSHLPGRRGAAVLAAIGAAPAPLATRLGRVTEERSRGLVVQMRRGPKIVLGDSSQLRAKWAAAARVLAASGTGGAAVIDVRLPSRPAVSGLGPGPRTAAAAAFTVAPAPRAPKAQPVPGGSAPATGAQRESRATPAGEVASPPADAPPTGGRAQPQLQP